ncbi:cupin domain-containing protein [Metabacillus sp. KIGAM252]|uniref:Cupin domain-containing protein n=1 Tax=Metabacillus flavus TaxID=2823519 RepID=A0ABS5L9J0_9BACI|nr:cupin domain-containing protein [Metabacillus flavus]MBS2967390.1 cupin domain-containing protein [Metabacillus flavus]
MYESQASPQFAFDMRNSFLFKKNDENYITIMGSKQLNTVKTSLLDIFLSKGNLVEPHYHQNAAELVYCISGSADVSILNPFTKQLLTYRISPQQVANVPQGWWHYEQAIEDNTHLLAIFNASNPEVVLGSDILKFTPASIMSQTYCISENEWKQVTEPVKPSTYIGPYEDCTGEERTPPALQPNASIDYFQPPHYWGAR